ncbi:SST2 [[Candida] subhashii]|uniref:SST2 n=1 Tax=[Candida] subhashii TaxID=561895 RepID=A0A8J5QQJ4_9ASCO|nr:SST2 [[Candida] subhashii]KAG7664785.1 SST2 [[Candida] subhashii]
MPSKTIKKTLSLASLTSEGTVGKVSVHSEGTMVNPQSTSDQSSQTAVIHEEEARSFHRTLNGKIFQRDIRDIFAMLILGLELKESKSKKFTLSKSYPFSFTIEDALEKMKDLNISIELSKTVASFSYKFPPDVALTLLDRFFLAKLIHCPADRTRSTPKPHVSLQPTPKGLALVQTFYDRIASKASDHPEVLQSNLNTMDLFLFDRDLSNDRILYSRYFIHLLFATLMGPKPNIWTPNAAPDPIPEQGAKPSSPTLFACGYNGEQGFSFSQFQIEKSEGMKSTHKKDSKLDEPRISPLYHRYFTNPESGSHVQYYVSDVGVRLCKDKTFTFKEPNVTFEYSVSGKAIHQWLMDCTDILNPSDACQVAGCLISTGLIKNVNPLGKQGFVPERDSFYRLTKLGRKVCQWDKDQAKKRSTSVSEFLKNPKKTVKEIKLGDILKDPGTRLQFRRHLNKEYCLENLDAYLQLTEFAKVYESVENLQNLRLKPSQESIVKRIDTQLETLRSTCLSTAYQIYITFLSPEAPFNVNIDYKLRAEIANLMTYSKASEAEESPFDTPVPSPTDEKDVSKDNDDWPVPAKEEKTETSSAEETPDIKQTLKDISSLFNQVSTHLYRLMESDSIPKFASSSLVDNLVY